MIVISMFYNLLVRFDRLIEVTVWVVFIRLTQVTILGCCVVIVGVVFNVVDNSHFRFGTLSGFNLSVVLRPKL